MTTAPSIRRRRGVWVGAAVCAGGVLTGQVAAQWTVTNLHPAGAGRSQAVCVVGATQAGNVDSGAGVWSSTAASWIDLRPVGATGESEVRAVYGGQQAGSARFGVQFGGFLHAGMWSGTIASWVDLHPAGAVNSAANGMWGNQQVGYASGDLAGFSSHAGMWSGTAASWVDLHPAAGSYSFALGASAGQQVGYVVFGLPTGPSHAALWSGTAASWVDLHPTGSAESVASAISGGQQVGYAVVSSVRSACLWRDTSASWVNLHPAGALQSEALGVFNGWQAGYARIGTVDRAGVWNGTPGSWEDITPALTGSWGGTRATGIWLDGGRLYVSGWGQNNSTGRVEALLWSRPICRADFNGIGGLTVQDVFDFLIAWFAGNPSANFNGAGGVTVQDVFDFLTAWFAGC